MKFRSITLFNFMRYKGENVLEFSCDPEKNVTVVLGNNTFGKTTLAQAFRWGLYEDLNTTNYTKKSDAILLNRDVIASMSANSVAYVSVEIIVEDGDTAWRFTRRAEYKRKNPGTNDLSITQIDKTRLTMIVIKNGIPGPVIDNIGHNTGPFAKEYQQNCVQETINNMLPPKLANYFFFDGERWSDEKTKKSEIRDSIKTILGVTGIVEMIQHLNGASTYTVMKSLQKKIQGSGDEFERLTEKIQYADRKIEQIDDDIKSTEENLVIAQSQRDKYWEELNNMHQAEEDKRKLDAYESKIESCQKAMNENYSQFVNKFSGMAKYFAASMLPEVDELLNKIDLEGKDIPGVTIDTIDYLLYSGTCLCGEKLVEGSSAYNNLVELKKVIPPKMIGGAAGSFRERLKEWDEDTKDCVSELEDEALKYASMSEEYDETVNLKSSLEKRMDKKANVAVVRKTYNSFKDACNTYSEQLGKLNGNKEVTEKQREMFQKQLEGIAAQTEANRKIRLAIEYVKMLYEMANKELEKKENGIFEELNEIIAENFDKMFQAKEKYAKLQDDYRIHVFYHNMGGRAGQEEKYLSNGEATALNFVYIVSILELARRRSKLESNVTDNDEPDTIASGIINLPLVLDGPFSSLSNENTQLIAKRLPTFAEQVIIFMLDKDWEASGLNEYTLAGYCRRIEKDEKANSSRIENGGT